MSDVTHSHEHDKAIAADPATEEKTPMNLTADAIADLLKRPRPTEEQRAVVEAPLTPAIVVAGAGSGKTETMANRVVWLVANGIVQPAEVLGLTFTRKAAGELLERIRTRLMQLGEALAGSDASLASLDAFDFPVVSTYNSFANSLFRDSAPLVSREPDVRLISESEAFLLARDVVVRSTIPGLSDIDSGIDDIAEKVLRLHHDMVDNAVSKSALDEYAASFTEIAELPSGRAGASSYANVVKIVGAVGQLPMWSTLADAVDREKRARGVVEFSDQVALARQAIEADPGIVADFRSRYRVVILDEYQDTSVMQTRLLSDLFHDMGVMAVGDPHQSIYSWRGASADTLGAFGRAFAREGEAAKYSLAISWRNDRRILDAANALVEPLRAAASIEVKPLGARPGAPEGVVTAKYFETVANEADAVAEWMRDELAKRPRATAAILFRSRRSMDMFSSSLESVGVPHRILGVGGLLQTPEVLDLVSALRVVGDPTDGSALIRVLSSPRWLVGPADIAALHRAARHIARTNSADLVDATLQLQDSGESLAEALDALERLRPEHPGVRDLTDAGRERLLDAAGVFRSLRGAMQHPLPDLVRQAEFALRLDIETVANETRTVGRANLDALYDHLTSFLANEPLPSLPGFLRFLRRAEKRDELAQVSETPEEGAVQLLTAHGAKGLEWDLVAIPRMVTGEIPSASREGEGWMRPANVPYDLLADWAARPVYPWRNADTQKELDGLLKTFKKDVADFHGAEERRVSYVALTRAKESLLLTGAWWASGVNAKKPSPYLIELAEHGVIGELPEEPREAENPLRESDETKSWPLDPLGERREVVLRAAEAVKNAAPLSDDDLEREITLLLAEQRHSRTAETAGELPVRLAAHSFKDLENRRSEVAQRVVRPVPERPYQATRLGTRFHEWVEQRAEKRASGDLVDSLAAEQDAVLDFEGLTGGDADLERLKQNFESSEWADRAPVAVECEINVPLGGHILIAKIDAVFETADGFEIVDWKTGRAPRDAEDRRRKELQLSIYRLAWARDRGIDPDRVSAAFYFVADNTTLRAEHLASENDLLEIIAAYREEAGRTAP